MEFVFLIAALGLIPAAVASKRGYSFFAWWIYGALLWIVAMPHALLLKPRTEALEAKALEQGGRRCPYCVEIIRLEAIVCKHCSRDVPPVTPESSPELFFTCGACGEVIPKSSARECPKCGAPYPFNPYLYPPTQ